MADELQRVFLWGVSRSMSTALLKCLSYVDGIQIVNQPYATAHFNGSDRVRPAPDPDDKLLNKFLAQSDEFTEEAERAPGNWLPPSSMSLQKIRDDLLESSYPDKKVLFCRDQAPYLDGRYDMLPRGFKYSFLIRHPHKVFRSWRKYLTAIVGEFSDMRTLPPIVFPQGRGFKELFELVQYVKENIDPHPIILDADDLLQDPAGILSTYCARMGMPYSSKLLSWEAGAEITNTWIECKTVSLANTSQEYYKGALESQRFGKPTPIPDPASLPEDVRACAEISMEYYQYLYSERITAST